MSGWLAMLALAALTSGLMGGLHCGAMCGALSGLARGPSPSSACLTIAAHGGRLTSYAMAGVLAGGVGEAGLLLRGGMFAQHALMLASGVALLLTAMYLMRAGALARHLEAAGARLWRHLAPALRRVLPADTVGKAAVMGVMWGWLPCGMVYGALLLALAAGSAPAGALVMLAFGAGTLPALLLTQVLARRFRTAIHARGARLTVSLCMAGAGAWLVVHAVDDVWPGAAGFICSLAGVSP